jgi:hypothetical protein
VANSAFNEVIIVISIDAIQPTFFTFQANNALVWRETVRIVHEWFSEIDDEKTASQRSVDLLEGFTHVSVK